MITRCRSKCWIISLLKEENQDLVLASTQRGVKGHIIIYPQQPSKLADVLPPPIEGIISPVCVLFVGSSPPTTEWLREHAKPLAVNAKRVRAALRWLKLHNPLYKDIIFSESCLQQLESNPHIYPNAANEAATSRYNSTPRPETRTQQTDSDGTIPFQNVVITDVDCHAYSNELRAAALRHVKNKGGGYIQIPHDRDPANEFKKDSLLFPMILLFSFMGSTDLKMSNALLFCL
ncbi:hypothetical protein DFH09DRAFT_1250699 [Mycena vulgaris]|nr:hypothetical protein DFH09DRAFT_1250699 [Mycena vulgaris]